MNAMSRSEAATALGAESYESYIENLTGKLQFFVGAFHIDPDSGRKCAFARALAVQFAELGECYLSFAQWDVWEFAEDFDLFDGYRKSLGIDRSIEEAPVHLLQVADEKRLRSLLSLGLFFVWDVTVFSRSETLLAKFSHDEWMEFYASTSALQSEVRGILNYYKMRPLSP